jgi:hypothetical protein
MLPEPAQNFKDMLFMGCKVKGVDEDVVKIHNDADV